MPQKTNQEHPMPTDFNAWLYREYRLWQGQNRANKTISQFAAYLQLPRITVSRWLAENGTIPSDYRSVIALSKKYPNLYEILDLPAPFDDDQQLGEIVKGWATLSPAKKERILAVLREQ
jgi:hypothetical protein